MQESNIPENKTDRPRRRSYTKEFKIKLVARCNQGDQSLAQIAMHHQINANLLRKWQREANRQPMNKMLPVKVGYQADNPPSTSYIEIAIGSVIVRFNGQVDPVSASTLLNLLR